MSPALRQAGLALGLVLLGVGPAAAQPVVPECKGALAPSVVGNCGGISSTGCCDVSGRSLWCEGGNLYCLDCGDGFDHCGWNALGYYDCGQDEGSADPTGTHPRSCTACGDGCGEAGSCSPGCPGECGSCEGAGEICLEDGSCWAKQCGDKACGTDAKGLSCGTCPSGTVCVDGLFQCLPMPEGCTPKLSAGCDGCACESCVCEKYPSCCTESWDAFCAAACELECDQGCSACPAEPSCGGIGCGSYCGVDCGSCPAGEVCHGYECCAPQCDGKSCGPDGCGGLCGTCEGNAGCVAGVCVACQPQCDGKTCGADGCGGTCGTCAGGTVCHDGKCAAGGCAGKCGGNSQGPWGTCWCDNQCVSMGDCCADACAVCAVSGCCTPSCAGKTCGDDGCGGSCGSCEDGLSCADGQCASDPCAHIGWEGCCDGGLLKYCENGQLSTQSCNNGCGWDGGHGYYNCGYAGAEPTGEHPLECPGEGCTPSCAAQTCGSDGCGGSCGTCPDGATCQGGDCVPDAPGGCGDVTWEGCCEGGTLRWCEGDAAQTMDCNGACGWNPNGGSGTGWYECGFDGADPSGVHPLVCGGGPGPDADPEPGPESAADLAPEAGPEGAETVEPGPEPGEDVATPADTGFEEVQVVEGDEDVAEGDTADGDVGTDGGGPIAEAPPVTGSGERPGGCGDCRGGASGGGWAPLAFAGLALLVRRRRSARS